MVLLMLTRWSPVKGKILNAGQIVNDVPDEVALDMIQRGLARPVKLETERAVGPGQVQHG